MKNFLYIFSLLFFNCTTLVGQDEISSCNKDSLGIQSIYSFLKLNDVYDPKIDLFLDKEIYQDKWHNGLCAIIFFANFFDKLLCENVNLNYSIVKNPPINNSSPYPLSREAEDNNKQYDLFLTFLMIKEKYEKYVLRSYYEDKDDFQLKKDVNKVINSGAFCKPNTLRKTLTNQYAHINKQKMYQEILKKEK